MKHSHIWFAASGPNFSSERFQRLHDYVVRDDDFREVGVVDASDDLLGTVVVPGEIVDSIDLDIKTDCFPEAYLGDYDGELDYITYEWQTRRYPVNAEAQGGVDGTVTVQAGRSDTISDAAMYPSPGSEDDVIELLDRLEADREEVRQTDIEALEADFDRAVYDLST